MSYYSTSSIAQKSYTRRNTCLVCGGSSGCAPSKAIDGGVACLRPDQADLSDWHKVKDLREGMGALFKPLADHEEEIRKWKEDQQLIAPRTAEEKAIAEFLAAEEARKKADLAREKAEKEHKEKVSKADKLNFALRDRQIRHWLTKYPLTEEHRENLHNRGLTDEAIKLGCFGSQKGYAMICPAFWGDQIIGFQNRLDNPDDGGKYRWGWNHPVPNHLDNGELPITVIGSSDDGTVNLTEGVLKPFICQMNRGGLFVGASGANFPEFVLRKALEEHKVKRAILWPDAGSRANQSVFKRYEALRLLLGLLDIPLVVADWGQWLLKDQPECDEIDSSVEVEFKDADEFFTVDEALEGIWRRAKKQKQWRARQKYSATKKLKGQYIDTPLPGVNTLSAFRFGMGRGKTQWLEDVFFSGLKDESVLMIGSKNNLLIQTCKRIRKEDDQGNVQGIPLHHIWEHSEEAEAQIASLEDWGNYFIAFCIHSISKFCDEALKGKNLVFDEAVTFLSTLLLSKTLEGQDPRDPSRGRREVALEKLKLALSTATRVVLMDANLPDFVVDFFAANAPHLKVEKIAAEENLNPKKIYLLSGEDIAVNDYSGLIAQIMEAVDQNETIAIGSDARSFTRAIAELLTDIESKVVRIDGDTSGEEWVKKEFLTDPDGWMSSRKIQVLLYSPAMGEGVNILKPFDRQILYFSNNSIPATEQVQMIGRIRHCDTREVFMLSHGIKKSVAPTHPYHYKKLQEALLKAEEDAMGGGTREFISQLEQDATIYDTASIFGCLHNYERNNPKSCLKYLLELNGDIVIEAEIEGNDTAKVAFKSAKKATKERVARDKYTSEDLEKEQVTTLKAKGFGGTYREQCALAKFYMKEDLPGIEESPVWSEDFFYLTEFESPNLISQAEKYYLYATDLDLTPIRAKKWEDKNSLWTFRSTFLEVDALKKMPLGPILESEKFCKDSPVIQNWLKSLRIPHLPKLDKTTKLTPKQEAERKALNSQRMKAIAKLQSEARWTPRADLRENPIQSLGAVLDRLGLGLERVDTVKADDGSKIQYYRVNFDLHDTPEFVEIVECKHRKYTAKLEHIAEWESNSPNPCPEKVSDGVTPPYNLLKVEAWGYTTLIDENKPSEIALDHPIPPAPPYPRNGIREDWIKWLEYLYKRIQKPLENIPKDLIALQLRCFDLATHLGDSDALEAVYPF
ncbi:hypothetical protein NG799_27680 [Laspinema sp. D1]|uniref:Replication origin-binding protein domain-containing protein n=1 Tax=Laspinema palackyanum D2a TaxID=2953684 RepID=A0ABT2MZC6_9CYAN|nr:hypothetical protein [Laspinema sp. D2a]